MMENNFEQQIQKNYDITYLMASFFDVHMLNPLLDFLRENEIYDAREITKEKIKVVEKTNMTELVEDEYNRFPDDSEFQAEYSTKLPILEERKNEIFNQIDNEPESVKLVAAFFADSNLINELKGSGNLTSETLNVNHGITIEALENYYRFSKFKYECGMYTDAEEMLSHFLSVNQPRTDIVIGALWGRLACRILQAKWTDSLVDIKEVKEAIEVRSTAPTDQLRQRAWLMHWGLFVYLNQRDGVEQLIDLFSEKVYLQAMENLCPWLLRYYTTAVILSPTRRATLLRDILAEISSMSYQYSDPITLFLESLFDQYDFDEAQFKLQECQVMIKNDFFLQIFADRFVHEARMLICEMYCTIHRKVDLTMLAEKLHLSDEDAEKWMVNLVLGTATGPRINAKIDSSGKQVIMSPPTKSTNQIIVEATRDLTARTSNLSTNLENLLQEQAEYLRLR